MNMEMEALLIHCCLTSTRIGFPIPPIPPTFTAIFQFYFYIMCLLKIIPLLLLAVVLLLLYFDGII